MVELDQTTQAKVLKQIEFYFSDSNLPKDKFLRQQVEAHPEGYVDLSLIISFQRMRDVLKLGTVRPEDVPDELVTAVAGALQASQLMEVHSSGFQVRRKTALPSAKEAARAVDSRSLYVRPFPMHASLDQIVAFFQDASAQLNAVRVRRHLRSKDFKGSVFVEATSVEEAQRVLGLALEFEGAPLRMERKQHYLARKIAERKAKKLGTSAEELTLAMLEEMDSDVEIPAISEINKDIQLPPAGAAASATIADAAPGGEQQPPAKKRKQSAEAADGADAEMADAGAAVADQAAAAEAAEPEVEQYDAGCILMLTLQGQPAESDPYRLTKMIKEALGPDKIRFVEQQRQQQQQQTQDKADADSAAAEQQQDGEQGQEPQQEAEVQPEQQQQEQQQEQQQAAVSRQFMVRFRQPDQAQELLQGFAAAAEAAEDKQVAGCAAELRLVEGEEEEQYYKRAAAQRAAAAKRGEAGGGRGGRGGGRGGFRGGGRGGRGGGGRGGGFRGGRGGRGRGRGRH